MSEKELEKLFKDTVKKFGGIAHKFVSPGTSGVPDRLVIFPGGQIGFVEVKAKGKKPRPEQEYQIRRLKFLGCKVFVLDDAEQIENIIEKIRGGQKP